MAESRSRREPRIDIDLTVTVQLPDRDVDYSVGDASYRGVFLVSEDPLPLRKLVRIETELPDTQEPLRMMGLVAHHISPAEATELERDPGMGIHLFSVGEETHRRWRDFVRRRYEQDPESRVEYKRLEHPHVVAHLPTPEKLAEYFDGEFESGEMFVRSSEVHAEGSPIICDIVHTDGEKALDLEGEVVGTVKSPPRKRGMNIAFTDLEEEDRERVREFVEGTYDGESSDSKDDQTAAEESERAESDAEETVEAS